MVNLGLCFTRNPLKFHSSVVFHDMYMTKPTYRSRLFLTVLCPVLFITMSFLTSSFPLIFAVRLLSSNPNPNLKTDNISKVTALYTDRTDSRVN